MNTPINTIKAVFAGMAGAAALSACGVSEQQRRLEEVDALIMAEPAQGMSLTYNLDEFPGVEIRQTAVSIECKAPGGIEVSASVVPPHGHVGAAASEISMGVEVKEIKPGQREVHDLQPYDLDQVDASVVVACTDPETRLLDLIGIEASMR